MRGSTGRRAPSGSTSRWSAWPDNEVSTATGWLPETAGSSASAMCHSGVPPAESHSPRPRLRSFRSRPPDPSAYALHDVEGGEGRADAAELLEVFGGE